MAGTADPNCQKDIPHHTTSCPGCKLGELPGRGQSLLGDRLGTDQWVVSNCIGHHLFHLGFVFFFFITIIIIISFITHYFVSIIKLFLAQIKSFFSFFFCLGGWCVTEWLCGV